MHTPNFCLFFILSILCGINLVISKKSLENVKFLKNQNIPNDFDMYVLSVQWGSTVCITGSKHCKDIFSSMPKNIFTLHGLWPSYRSGKNMGKCNTGEEISIIPDSSDLFDFMKVFWISYSRGNEDFWSHEYNTHGLCYTDKFKLNDYKPFFEYSMGLFNQFELDQIMKKACGDLNGLQEFSISSLKNQIEDVVAPLKFEIACKRYDHKQYLQEIIFFFDLDSNPIDVDYSTNCNESDPIYVNFQ